MKSLEENGTWALGAGATVYSHPDSMKAFTVIRVTTRTIIIQRDMAILLNGVNSGEPDALQLGEGGRVGGAQRWEYQSDPEGYLERVTQRQDGSWRVARSNLIVMPGRSEFFDFNYQA
jgi:hypothetical protein